MPQCTPDLAIRPAPSVSPLPSVIQPKLAIGSVDDPLEHEADRVADQVIRMPSPDRRVSFGVTQVSRKCEACEQAVADASSTRRPVLRLRRAMGNRATVESLPELLGRRLPATVQRVPLTESEKAVDPESAQLRDDDRLQRAFDNNPPVQFGESGPHVAKIQQALLDCGFVMPRSTRGGAPDGIFGEETLRVVKGFQKLQGVDPDGIVGRRTLGELDGRLTGKKPPGSGPSGPAPPASGVNVSPVDVVPLTLLDCGEFLRKFNWTTNARNGYLIQEVRSSRSRQDCAGADLGDDTVAKRYWEAWRVQEDGEVHPRFDGVNDTWARSASEGRGSWSLTGDVFFVEQLDPAAGFSPLSGTEAGALNATTTKPSNLGKQVFTHSAGGRWDCCGPVKTHVPSAPRDEGAEKNPTAEPATGQPTNL